MSNTHSLVRGCRVSPFLVYCEGENVNCAWAQLIGEYSHCTVIAPNGPFYKRRLGRVLQIQDTQGLVV